MRLLTIKAKSLKLGIIIDLLIVKTINIAFILAIVIDKKIVETKTSFLIWQVMST